MWALISLAAAFFLAAIALDRGEPVNSFWLVLAAACTYLLGFRFYAKFIAAKVMALNDQRATPAERLRDGQISNPPINGSSSATISPPSPDPGPLVGPVLAAQFGYLPGALDPHRRGAGRRGAGFRHFVLFPAAGRQIAGPNGRGRNGKAGGFMALLAILLIMVILLAVLALVVVNALEGSPWGLSPSRRPFPSRSSWAAICASGGRARSWNAP